MDPFSNAYKLPSRMLSSVVEDQLKEIEESTKKIRKRINERLQELMDRRLIVSRGLRYPHSGDVQTTISCEHGHTEVFCIEKTEIQEEYFADLNKDVYVRPAYSYTIFPKVPEDLNLTLQSEYDNCYVCGVDIHKKEKEYEFDSVMGPRLNRYY